MSFLRHAFSALGLMSLALLCVSLTSCQQMRVGLAPVQEFRDHEGRLFVHNLSPYSATETKVFVDGKEILDFMGLGRKGLKQPEGSHELSFSGLPNGKKTSKLNFDLARGKDHHLFYCEKDGSFRWYELQKGEKPGDVIQRVCNKVEPTEMERSLK